MDFMDLKNQIPNLKVMYAIVHRGKEPVRFECVYYTHEGNFTDSLFLAKYFDSEKEAKDVLSNLEYGKIFEINSFLIEENFLTKYQKNYVYEEAKNWRKRMDEVNKFMEEYINPDLTKHLYSDENGEFKSNLNLPEIGIKFIPSYSTRIKNEINGK